MLRLDTGWRRCSKCQAMWYSPYLGESHCPAGGNHDFVARDNFGVLAWSAAVTPPPQYERNWHRCVKCAGLFHDDGETSVCPVEGGPAGRQHQGTQALERAVYRSGDGDTPQFSYPAQSGWRRCKNCQGLILPTQSNNVCPAGGGHHDYDPSGNYTLVYGPYVEQLNVIVQLASNHIVSLCSSPTGAVADLFIGAMPILGTEVPTDQSGGAIAVIQVPNERVFYAYRSNEGDNRIMLGSVSQSGIVATPFNTGIGIVGDPNPVSPAFAMFKGKLYMFYVTWNGSYGWGPVYCVEIQGIDSDSGAVTIGPASVASYANNQCGGRISATANDNILICSWMNLYNGTPNYSRVVGAAYTTGPGENGEWTWADVSFSTEERYVNTGLWDSPTLVTRNDGQIFIGWRGQINLYCVSFNNQNKTWNWPSNNLGVQPVSNVACNACPTLTAAVDGSGFYLALGDGGGALRVMKLKWDLSELIPGQSVTIDAVKSGSPPSLLSLFAGGTPPDD